MTVSVGSELDRAIAAGTERLRTLVYRAAIRRIGVLTSRAAGFLTLNGRKLQDARWVEQMGFWGPDADVGALLGWGFPAWTGGPLSLIETVGLEKFVAEVLPDNQAMIHTFRDAGYQVKSAYEDGVVELVGADHQEHRGGGAQEGHGPPVRGDPWAGIPVTARQAARRCRAVRRDEPQLRDERPKLVADDRRRRGYG